MVRLILGNSFDILQHVKPERVDMIFADPPYFLSNNGVTCKSGKLVSVNKGDWDKLSEETTTIDKKHEFNRKWIKYCKSILKPNGSIWISGTMHNIYSIGMALEQEGFKIINNITWQKTNPPPNLACKCFTHSTETILWAKKNDKESKPFFDYALMKELNGGKVSITGNNIQNNDLIAAAGNVTLTATNKVDNKAGKAIFAGNKLTITAKEIK